MHTHTHTLTHIHTTHTIPLLLPFQAMLAEYAASPAANWKSKDCAIYIVLALTIRGKTGEVWRVGL